MDDKHRTCHFCSALLADNPPSSAAVRARFHNTFGDLSKNFLAQTNSIEKASCAELEAVLNAGIEPHDEACRADIMAVLTSLVGRVNGVVWEGVSQIRSACNASLEEVATLAAVSLDSTTEEHMATRKAYDAAVGSRSRREQEQALAGARGKMERHAERCNLEVPQTPVTER